MRRRREPREDVVTFLLTDIEGSTVLLRRLGRSYADVVASHRTLLRRAATDRGGRQVDAIGDSTLFAFASADDAARAAIAAQLVLPALGEIRVRMAVHTGPVWRNGREFVGLTVHKVARICRLAAGGEVLTSSETLATLSPHVRTPVGTIRPHLQTPRDFEAERVFTLWPQRQPLSAAVGSPR